MRNLHKLLLTAAGIATMAVAAPTAGATSGVEVVDAVSDEHCGDITVTSHVVAGGCEFSATSEGGAATPSIELLIHTGMSEMVITLCSIQFDAHVNEEGHGYITNQVLTGDDCGLTACDEATHEEIPWEFQLGELLGEHEALGMTFCIRLDEGCVEGDNPIPPCSVLTEISEPQEHEYELTANDAPCLENSALELSGHWLVDDPTVEIQHL